MNTTSLVRTLKKWWWLFAALCLLGGATGAAAALVVPPVYSATSEIYVTFDAPGAAGAGDLVMANNYALQKVYSYQEVAVSPRVLQQVIDDLGLDTTTDDLEEQVSVSVPPNSVVMSFTASAPTAAAAAELSSATVAAFTDVVGELEQPADGGAAPIRVESLQDAVPPLQPSSPQLLLFVAIGLFVGLAVSLVLLAVMTISDRRIHSSKDLERVSPRDGATPTLGSVPREASARSVFAVLDAPRGRPAESYRTIAASLVHAASPVPQIIAVAPCTPRESASALSSNLALTLAESGARVVVVDANLRSGRITNGYDLLAAPGLAQYLEGTAQLADVIVVPERGGVAVVPAGTTSESPAELIGSPRFVALMRELRAAYDLVVVDASPVIPLSDALYVAAAADAVVLAVTAGQVTEEEIAAAGDALDSMSARVIGRVVLEAPVSGIDAEAGLATYRDLKARTPR